jgi:hypothetical protein
MGSSFSYEEASSPAFWKALCPSCSIDENSERANTLALPAGWEKVSRQWRKEGYIALPSVLSAGLVSALLEAVEASRKATGLPLFAMVYDECWEVVWRVSRILQELLGGDVRVLPDCWVWWLDPTREEAGWAPHRDRVKGTLAADGTPHVISLWLPLTDATPLNGCMYVLPAHLDPVYGQPPKRGDVASQSFQHMRAVPAPAGSMLCWTQQLLHWGGTSSEFAESPRVSMAFEIQRSDVPAFSTPLFRVDEPPDFSLRLGLIGRQILQYQHIEQVAALPNEMVAMARKLHRNLPQKRSFSQVLGGLFRPSKE